MKTVYIKRNDLFKSIDMLLCNNITSVDESFIEDNFELFFSDCDECKGDGTKDSKTCDDCMGDGRHESEPYQYFLCRLDDWEKERLNSYGVEVGYSEKLDLHVLPIYDYGTSWSMFSYSKEVPNDYELSFDETLTRSTSY